MESQCADVSWQASPRTRQLKAVHTSLQSQQASTCDLGKCMLNTWCLLHEQRWWPAIKKPKVVSSVTQKQAHSNKTTTCTYPALTAYYGPTIVLTAHQAEQSDYAQIDLRWIYSRLELRFSTHTPNL
jgi:hypothetical protein